MKPIIGLSPLYDSERSCFWMRATYREVLVASGAVPIVLPYDPEPEDVERVLSVCDGLLLTGGADIQPSLYGQAPSEHLGPLQPKRDELDSVLFRTAYDWDMPVFGICRGMQFINVSLGGTLYQDLPTQKPQSYDHVMKSHYETPSHWVEILEETPLAEVVGQRTFPVNSIHHQAVHRLADGLAPMALSVDGLIEGVWDESRRFCMGVQWHPEFAWHEEPRQQKIMRAFVEACEG